MNKPHLTAVPGLVLGSDIEDQAAELADDRDAGGREDVTTEPNAATWHDRDLGMTIRSLTAEGARDVLLTLTDRWPGLVGLALDDCAATWDPDGPDALAARED